MRGQRTSRCGAGRGARWPCALAIALVALLTACGAEPPPSGSEARWARRFLPFDGVWRREAEIPSEPQDEPAMVIWEVTVFEPGTQPSAEQTRAGEALVEASYAAALANGWYDVEKGLADGYRRMFMDTHHYVREDYVFDDHVLDPTRPEFLMYYDTPQGKQLAGFMFYAPTPYGRGPQLGPQTVWHYHVWNFETCLDRGILAIALPQEGRCEHGVPSYRSPEMLHVWLLDLPKGHFGSGMLIRPHVLAKALAQRERERPEVRAARVPHGDPGA